MTEDHLREFLRRGQAAQAAVDEVLSPAQQAAEQQTDGTYRVLCSNCGKSVSNPLPVPVIIRAWVECPECVRAARAGG